MSMTIIFVVGGVFFVAGLVFTSLWKIFDREWAKTPAYIFDAIWLVIMIAIME